MLNEANIINFLQKKFPLTIGDDAAAIPCSKKESFLLTKDLLIEDVHFRTKYQNARSLAVKALQVNLSDIAAMGGIPKYVLLGLSIPKNYELYLDEFLSAFSAACKASNVSLIGGDTTSSPDKLFISVTVVGSALNTNIKFRNRATTGDVICVAGNLGYAHVGLTALEQQSSELDYFKKIFLKPQALIHEGIWLGKQAAVTAMMDVSDGLYIDLQRLCHASKKLAKINLDNLRPTKKFITACNKLALAPITTELTGGEDYGLLATIKVHAFKRIATKFATRFGYELKVIGEILDGKGVAFIQNGYPKKLDLKPFSHFGEL